MSNGRKNLQEKRPFSLLKNGFSKTERETLDNVLELAIRLSGAETGSIVLPGEDGHLVVAVGKGLREQYIGRPITEEESVSQQVFQSGVRLVIGEGTEYYSSRRQARQPFSISLPIQRENGHILGVLNLNRSARGFSREGMPHIEALTKNITLLLEENHLRRERERVLVALSEITSFFGSVSFLSENDEVFQKVFYSVKILTGIKQGAVLKMSRQRPYLVFRHDWPKSLTWKKLEPFQEDIRKCVSAKEVTSIQGNVDTLLLVPIQSDINVHYIFLALQENGIDLMDYLVISGVGKMASSALQNLYLFGKTKRLARILERNRLARELHDGLAQILASTQIYLHFLEKNIPFMDEPSREIFDKIKNLNDLGIEESRFIISELKGKPVPLLRVAEKVEEVASVFTHPGYDLKIKVNVGAGRVSFGSLKMIAMVVQETLSNIQKHSKAHHATVHLSSRENALVLRIEDDGVGFDSTRISHRRDGEHFGLSNLRERVRLLRGSFRIHSRPGKGTRVTVRIPFEDTGG